jgi:hypothetical protein
MRVDFLFSYWIVFWYILFMFNLISYNPKFVLVVALIQNTVLFIYKLWIGSFLVAFLLGIIILCMKVIPLYTLYDTKIKKKDIYFSIVLFILYIIWIYLNGTHLYDIMIEINNNKGPLMVSMMSRI